jgi:hypothetical protein
LPVVAGLGYRELSDIELNAVSGGAPKSAAPVAAPKETITFAYGGMAIQYGQQ